MREDLALVALSARHWCRQVGMAPAHCGSRRCERRRALIAACHRSVLFFPDRGSAPNLECDVAGIRVPTLNDDNLSHRVVAKVWRQICSSWYPHHLLFVRATDYPAAGLAAETSFALK